jgi:hypothetical protein
LRITERAGIGREKKQRESTMDMHPV